MTPLDKMLGQIRRDRRIRRLASRFTSHFVRESYYRDLLVDAAAALEIRLPVLYPVGSAANYSLLYAIFRAVTELPVRRVLDLGGGQSSFLLDALAEKYQLSITTLEQDEYWAARVGSQVRHPVVHAPLESRTYEGVTAAVYPPGGAGPEGVDLLIVDGPVGVPVNSRWGALEIAARSLAPEYLVIFDDAERPGEQDTVRRFVKTRNCETHRISGTKWQILAFSPAFAGARFF